MQSQDQVSVEVAGIVEEAWHALGTLEHYQRDGEETGRARLEALYRQVTRAVASLDLDGLRAHAARIARVRHEAGYERSEVLAAFYALEDAVWRHASSQLPEADRGWGLGLVGTAFANARENTHHNNYGSYELAKCIVEGVKANKLGLADYVIDGLPAFNPAQPDAVETFSLPLAPRSSVVKPDGN